MAVNPSKLIVVGGPTASGKTACAVELCDMIGGEVVSADSMQIYAGMDILSAKPTEDEKRGIAHHMLGIAKPAEKYSASAYREEALRVIADIRARGKTPVLCGGSGLYIDAVTKDMRFSEPANETFRDELTAIAETEGGKKRLHDRLRALDPESAARFPPEDVRRVIRSLEIVSLTGMTRREQEALDRACADALPADIFALSLPMDVLYDRINRRVDQMVEAGVIHEVRALMDGQNAHPTAIQAIGYKEIACALRGECAMPQAIENMKTATRHYAKRQMTWLRRDPRVIWIDALNRAPRAVASEILTQIKQQQREIT